MDRTCPMPLLYNILYKPKEKMTQTVKFSTRRCVPFRCVWGGGVYVGQVVCLIRTPVKGVITSCDGYVILRGVSIRTPVKGVIAKRDKKSRFMGGSPHLPPENHLVLGEPPTTEAFPWRIRSL